MPSLPPWPWIAEQVSGQSACLWCECARVSEAQTVVTLVNDLKPECNT